jgi:DNA-binding response OmpR family regulator
LLLPSAMINPAAQASSSPATVVLVLDDLGMAEAAGEALLGIGYRVMAFADANAARSGLGDVPADLVVTDYEKEGAAGASIGGAAPWIALVAADDPGSLIDALEDGADDCIRKPPDPALLVVKVRAALRRAARAAAGSRGSERRGRPLSGTVGAAGALSLFKFCEDHLLTGRLTVDLGERVLWVDFRGGEVTTSGARPSEGDDALDSLLAARRGRYVIEQTRLDPHALEQSLGEGSSERVGEGAASPAALPAGDVPFAVPLGRLSAVDAMSGDPYQVQTEGANAPEFAVTTIVARGGRVIRKMRKSWQHPLRRYEDGEAARRAIDDQHDGVVARLRQAVVSRAEGGNPDSIIEGPLLAWALHLIVEKVWLALGTTVTRSLLERTRRAVATAPAAVEWFRITRDAQVEMGGGAAPPGAMAAAAEWMARFMMEARRTDEAAEVRPREATAVVEAALERSGFYRAMSEAADRIIAE